MTFVFNQSCSSKGSTKALLGTAAIGHFFICIYIYYVLDRIAVSSITIQRNLTSYTFNIWTLQKKKKKNKSSIHWATITCSVIIQFNSSRFQLQFTLCWVNSTKLKSRRQAEIKPSQAMPSPFRNLMAGAIIINNASDQLHLPACLPLPPPFPHATTIPFHFYKTISRRRQPKPSNNNNNARTRVASRPRSALEFCERAWKLATQNVPRAPVAICHFPCCCRWRFYNLRRGEARSFLLLLFFSLSFSACPPWVGELTHLGRQRYAWQGRRRRLASATFTNGNNFNFSDALSRPRTYVAAEVVPRPTCPHPPPTPTILRHAHPRSPPLAEPKLNTVGCPARTKTLQLKVADLRLGATKKTGKTKKKQQRR